ncbi:MAG: tRNA pseudouridine synthase A, partial [Gammaproteobacteria bacterium]
MRIALGVEYDGGAFSGYQFQSHAPSVQDSLEQALSHVAAEPIRVEAAGRTDAGVHATKQVVAFDTAANRPSSAWVKGTNAQSPDSLSVVWAQRVPDDFHPRFQATARRYMYLFYEADEPSPLVEGRAVRSAPLDASVLMLAAAFSSSAS